VLGVNLRSQTQILSPVVSSEEAAVIAAVIEQLKGSLALYVITSAAPKQSAWSRAALAEGVSRKPPIPVAFLEWSATGGQSS
jgi:hypothetical protein